MKKLFLVCAAFGLYAILLGTPVPEVIDFRKNADMSIEFHWKKPENMNEEQKTAWQLAEKKALEQIEKCKESDKMGDDSICCTEVLANLVLECAKLFRGKESVVTSIQVNPKQ